MSSLILSKSFEPVRTKSSKYIPSKYRKQKCLFIHKDCSTEALCWILRKPLPTTGSKKATLFSWWPIRSHQNTLISLQSAEVKWTRLITIVRSTTRQKSTDSSSKELTASDLKSSKLYRFCSKINTPSINLSNASILTSSKIQLLFEWKGES